MYIINHFSVKSYLRITKNLNSTLGIALFVLFPYIYVLGLSLKGIHFIHIFLVSVTTVFVLLLDVKKIILCNHDLLWLGPIWVVLFSAIKLNSAAITFCTLFTIGIMSILLLRNKYNKLEFGLGIMQLLSVLTAVTVIINKISPDFWINLIGRYYNADALGRMSRDISGYCNGIFFSVACTAGFLVNGFSVALYNLKKKNVFILPLIFLGIVYTNKRAHLFFAVLAFFVVMFLESRQFKKLIYIIVATVSLIVSIQVFIVLYDAKLIPNDTIRLIDTIYRLIKDHDLIQILGVRWKMYQEAIDLFKQHKLLGIGWFQYVIYDANGDATHNIYLQLLCETGIIGLILFMLPIFTEYVKTIKLLYHPNNTQIKKYLRISLYMQTFFLAYGITGNPLYDHNFLFAYFWSLAIYEICAYKISTTKKGINIPYYIQQVCTSNK